MVNKTTQSILWIFLVVFSGCSQNVDKEKQVDLNQIKDQLRSLPYVSFSKTQSGQESGVVENNEEVSCPGYNLYVTRSLCLAELLDHKGNIVQSWHDHTFRIWQDFELLPDGTFLVIGQKKTKEKASLEDPFENRAILKLSWQGEKLEEISIQAHHEIHFSAGKPLLTLLFDHRSIPELHSKTPVLDNRIATLSEHGEVIDSLSLYDLLNGTPGFKLQKVKESDYLKVKHIDLVHTNTVEWIGLEANSPIYSRGNIIVTMRHQDTVAIIDWEKKRVVWTWGQGELSGPHDATMLENGNILIFDNGLGREWSRVVEMNPLSKEIVWEYRDPELKNFYSTTRGTSQRLPNGNTLITESNKGRVFEVLPSGEVVWDFYTPHKNNKGHRANIIRMRRYSLNYIQNIQKPTKTAISGPENPGLYPSE